jgi:hypothetical protein
MVWSFEQESVVSMVENESDLAKSYNFTQSTQSSELSGQD